MRRLLLSTVFRNTPDGAGGVAPKPDDVPVVAPAADAVAAATVAPEPPAAVAPEPAPGGEPAAPAAPEPAPAAEAKPAEPDFAASTLLTGEEPKPGEPAKAPELNADGTPKAPTEAPVGDPPKPGEAAPKPAEGAAPAEAPKVDAPPAPVVAPIAYTYQFPENVKIDDAALKPVNETFAKHGVSAEAAQEFMGMHVTEMQRYAEQLTQDQGRTFAETRAKWREEIQSDPVIGGAGYQTALQKAAQMRDKFVKPEDMAEFNRFLLYTGAGDHPAFIKLMNNAHRFAGEPIVPVNTGNPPASNGRPGGPRRMRDNYKTA